MPTFVGENQKANKDDLFKRRPRAVLYPLSGRGNAQGRKHPGILRQEQSPIQPVQ